MRILLIRPHDIGNINTRLPDSLNKRQGVVPPLGISYIASTLEKAGHIIKIMDVIALNLIVDEIRQNIHEFKPDIVGITTMTSSLFGSLESARIAKDEGAITVLGGPQLSIYPKETLSYPYVDYGINGEGEYVMLKLIETLEKKTNPDNVKGLIYKKNNGIFVNDPAIVEDIDSLPFPAYHLLPMSRYNCIIALHPVSTMISTRGCPYKCHFCFKQPSDQKPRYRSPRSVVDEMQYLTKKYKVREIMFYDDIMTLYRPHIVGICEEILSRNIKVKWETPTRVDHIDKELLKLMHKAGCIRLRFGVESGDPQILKTMNKGIDLAMAREAFRLTKKVGMQTFAYFMVGYLHDTPRSLENTLNFAKILNPDFVLFTITVPYPETPLYDAVRKEGIITQDYWREFTLGKKKDRIPYLVPDADKWVKKCYWSFYLRPKYILNSLSRIRSWDSIEKHFRALAGLLKWEVS